MKYAWILSLFVVASCSKADRMQTSLSHSNQQSITAQQTSNGQAATLATTPVFMAPRHTFVIWFENKGYSQIVGNSNAPYINSLIKKGTLFTNAHALTHPSYPNYVAWFSGSTQGIKNDDCINGAVYSRKTVYNYLSDKGVSFQWYSEGLPFVGSRTCQNGYYVEKHNPTTIFSTVAKYVNQPLSAMNRTDTANFKKSARVSCITPNLTHDMHDGSIAQGDSWLKQNFSTLINWCLIHHSVFIIYFDEDNGTTDNRIPVIMLGLQVKAGYKDATYYNHYSFTKSILHWWGADSTFTSHLANAKTIQNIWN
jgi:hypothetical protein